jgi:hypothetical protein
MHNKVRNVWNQPVPVTISVELLLPRQAALRGKWFEDVLALPGKVRPGQLLRPVPPVLEPGYHHLSRTQDPKRGASARKAGKIAAPSRMAGVFESYAKAAPDHEPLENP